MKNTQKQGKESGKVQLALLVAVVLAAGAAGVWSELQAGPPTKGVGQEIDCNAADYSASVFLNENGDGTATLFVGATLDDGTSLSAFNFANADYSISNNLQPGQSGKGSFSGTGHFTQAGEVFDPSTGTSTPVIITGDVAVANADNVSASVQQGIYPSFNPFTGETHVFRQHSSGNQAFGFTAGSISVSADGVVFKQVTGAWGNVSTFSYLQKELIR